MKKNKISRRHLLQQGSLAAGAGLIGMTGLKANPSDMAEASPFSLKSSINHSVCRWCYNGIPFETFCEQAKGVGVTSIELTGPDDWPVLKRYGLTCARGTFGLASIPDGFNEQANHAKLQEGYKTLIAQAADHGIPQVIVFSGNRRDLTDEEGLENCAVGLDPLVKEAEAKGVTISMELLNSKVNHPDYMCDHTDWGVALAEKIGSPRFKLLYDIYHMQIMEGDIIATIRDNHQYISHYHTGGVTGRNEINDSQELNYPAIMRAILETCCDGDVAQEVIPTDPDKIKALEEGIKICDVTG